MALADPYVTAAQLKTRLGIADNADDTAVTAAVTAASRWIDSYCHRATYGFNVTATPTARVYYPTSSTVAAVDDISSTTSLAVKIDTGDDGTYETTWTEGTHFQLEPLNALSDGIDRPYDRIVTLDGHLIPTAGSRPGLQVTALWGWPAVPSLVTEACYQLAAETFKLKEAPFGVAGVNDYGVLRIGNQTLNRVQAMLAGYVAGSGVLVA